MNTQTTIKLIHWRIYWNS